MASSFHLVLQPIEAWRPENQDQLSGSHVPNLTREVRGLRP